MSWVASLCALYEANSSQVGHVKERSRGGRQYPLILLPVSHTTVQARIEVTLDQEGELLNARILREDESAETIAPSTEGAMSRTSTTVAPYPLFDGLEYVAGDFAACLRNEDRVAAIRENIDDCFATYIAFLGSWCASEFAHPKVCAIHRYLSKQKLTRDLIAHGVLKADSEGYASSKQKINKGAIAKAVVRFRVRSTSDSEVCALDDYDHAHDSAVWLDRTVQQSFIRFYASLPAPTDLCYLSGEVVRTSVLHPKRFVMTETVPR